MRERRLNSERSTGVYGRVVTPWRSFPFSSRALFQRGRLARSQVSGLRSCQESGRARPPAACSPGQLRSPAQGPLCQQSGVEGAAPAVLGGGRGEKRWSSLVFSTDSTSLVLLLDVSGGGGPGGRPRQGLAARAGVAFVLGAWMWGLPWWLSWERIRLKCWRPLFNSWVRKIPLEKG